MDELVNIFGSAETYQIDVDWEPSLSERGGDLTRGAVRLLVEGNPIWYGENPEVGIEWTWIDLLEFLSNAWPSLVFEDGGPLGLGLDTPTQLIAESELLTRNMPGIERLDVLEAVDAYLEVHELSRGIPGAVLPQILVGRTGRTYVLSTDGRRLQGAKADVLGPLEAFADGIAQRLSDSPDPRALRACQAWASRLSVEPELQVELATGITSQLLDEIEDSKPRAEYWEVTDRPADESELVAAARLSGHLGPAGIQRVVETVRGAEQRRTPELDELAIRAVEALQGFADESPPEQGHAIAVWLRRELGLAEDERAEPANYLSAWNVQVEEFDAASDEIDAVACWGRHRGPSVFLNVSGRRNRKVAGRRFTYSHEICHLLIDRQGALPLAEVVGGRGTWQAEARAGAFAAELLLPRTYVGHRFATTSDIKRDFWSVLRRFGVGRDVAAWQAKNSGADLDPGVYRFLRTQVRHSSRF